MFKNITDLELGLGLISIGRPWPTDKHPICHPAQAHQLLQAAIDNGVRFFDTAAAYGTSEKVLGEFLNNLDSDIRDSIIIATKTGEIWPMPANEPIDHSLKALETSFNNSLQHLGTIDLLQLHKTMPKDMQDDKLLNWFQNLKKTGAVTAIGVSISTAEALKAALDVQIFDSIQFPANLINTELLALYLTYENPPMAIINRPLASGQLADRSKAMQFLNQKINRGIILSGTSNSEHLKNNLEVFEQSKR